MAKLEPKAGKKYENKLLVLEDRTLVPETAEEQGRKQSSCERELNELGDKGWVLVHAIHVGGSRNVFFLVREKVS